MNFILKLCRMQHATLRGRKFFSESSHRQKVMMKEYFFR